MRPALIDSMSWEMAEVYGAITDQILINLAHYFPYYNARNFPRSSITYYADMLAQMGQVNTETMAIIRRNLVGCDKYLNAALEQVIIDSVRTVNPTMWQAVKKGIFMPPKTPVLAPNQYRAFDLYYKQAADKLNLVNTVMLESTKQAYTATVADIAARVQATQTALDIGAGEVVTGVSSWNKATAHAINRMKQNGITGFIDHGGHRWSAEAYVAMDIRTTMFNTGRAAVWETNQNFGNDLYQVSYHNGARPLCYPWQSKVISSTDDARVVTDLDGYEVQVYAQSETSYGEPAGLFGINCKHYPTPFIPGVSLIRDGGQSEEENEKTYAESQQQRGLERKIREEKRDLLMLKAQGAPDDIIKAQRAKIRETDDEIDAFCDATGRARRQNREGVYTKRQFPAADTYDVATFEHEQQNLMRQYYENGGAQQGYTFGQMIPKNQPTPPTTPAPVQLVPKNVAQQATQTAQNMVQSSAGVKDVKSFGEFKQYMKSKYDIDVTNGISKLDFDLVKDAMSGFEDVIKDFPEVSKGIKRMRLSKTGVMSCNGEQITFNSEYFTDPNKMKDEIAKSVKSHWWQEGTTVASIGAHETAHGIEAVLIEQSGKYTTQRSKIFAWNGCYEARDIVAEACNELLRLPENQGKTAFELIKEGVSKYGAKGGNSETMAEAFSDVNARGEGATPLAKKIYEITLKKYRKYMGVTP